jgi:hypothetical protein
VFARFPHGVGYIAQYVGIGNYLAQVHIDRGCLAALEFKFTELDNAD